MDLQVKHFKHKQISHLPKLRHIFMSNSTETKPFTALLHSYAVIHKPPASKKIHEVSSLRFKCLSENMTSSSWMTDERGDAMCAGKPSFLQTTWRGKLMGEQTVSCFFGELIQDQLHSWESLLTTVNKVDCLSLQQFKIIPRIYI